MTRASRSYPDAVYGRKLMLASFDTETGPLTDKTAVPSEREAEMFLFTGAIGHAKNPVSHRDLNLTPEESARLIVFASHLLDIVDERARSKSST